MRQFKKHIIKESVNKSMEYIIEKGVMNEIKKNPQTEKIRYSDAFIEKVIKYIKNHYPEVVKIKKDRNSWFKGWKEFLHIYVDEDDGQPTNIVQHPLEWTIHWDLMDNILKGLNKSIDIRVTNLNKGTKLRGHTGEGINESYNRYDETIPNKDFVDKVVKRMVDKTEVNLYMEDYDPWKQGSPWFGDFITPQFPNDKKHKLNISWLVNEYLKPSLLKYFANELIEAYAFSTLGQLEYFDSEYYKKLKEKVDILKIPFIEKRQKQKEEYRRRHNLSESRKDIKKERDDIERAVQDLNRLHNFDVSYEEMTRGIANSSPQPLSSEIWDELENTESNEISVGDFDKVFDISNKYNKSNPLKLKKKLSDGTYNYPIIIRFDDRYWLVAGNTRLCTAAAMGITPEVIIADINKPYPVDESLINKNLKKL